jgi:hypothetical protein
MDGIVNIHGKDYKTVALRVNEFREIYTIKEGWAIQTEIVSVDADCVIMKASIVFNDKVLATGYAEEMRKASTINRTSALENCETSAIGRALAACGLGGSQYASADEVRGAIASQDELIMNYINAAKLAVDKEDWLSLCLLDVVDDPIWKAAWKKLGPQQGRIKELIKRRLEYSNQFEELISRDDKMEFEKLNDELTKDEAREVCRIMEKCSARDFLIQLNRERE